MAARLIPFPLSRVFRSPQIIEALEMLERCEAQIAIGNRIERAMAGTMREFWEGELAGLGGVPVANLRRDGVSA